MSTHLLRLLFLYFKNILTNICEIYKMAIHKFWQVMLLTTRIMTKKSGSKQHVGYPNALAFWADIEFKIRGRIFSQFRNEPVSITRKSIKKLIPSLTKNTASEHL
jgi:hypothetical protein